VLLLSLFLSGSVIATMIPQPNAALTTLNVGNTAVGSQSLGIAQYKDGSKIQLLTTATIQSVTVYFASYWFNAKAAIYSDSNGAPAALLSQSSSKYIRSTGWATFSITQSSLSAGTYWLVVRADSSSAKGRVSYGGSGLSHVQKQGGVTYSSEFTSSFGTVSLSDAGSVSIYATFSASSPPTPTATATPTQTPTSTPTPTPSPTKTPSPTPTSTPSPTSSSVKFGIYSNSACTSAVSSIPWGQLAPGAVQTLTFYIRNEGTQSITLSKSLANWSPSTLSSYLTLSWNYNGQNLNPSSVLAVTLSLTVAANTPSTTGFSFDTIISGATSTTPTSTPSSTLTPTPTPSATPTSTPSPPSSSAKFGIYINPTCTSAVSSISWGQLKPGAVQTLTFYIRNEGTSSLTLSKSLANWNPSTLSGYLTLTWNYTSQVLVPSSVLAVTLSLAVAANTPSTASFSFDTIISGATS
jgi:archaellum component FlaG (FlaF/FlaG flagellin family)